MGNRDWHLCFLCQTITKEAAKNPADHIRYGNNRDAFTIVLNEIVRNIHELNGLGELPIQANVSDIIDVNQQETVNFMLRNSVLFHKTCRDMINQQKVERARVKHQTVQAQ